MFVATSLCKTYQYIETDLSDRVYFTPLDNFILAWSSTKWFIFFITNVRYSSAGVIELIQRTPVRKTRQFQICIYSTQVKSIHADHKQRSHQLHSDSSLHILKRTCDTVALALASLTENIPANSMKIYSKTISHLFSIPLKKIRLRCWTDEESLKSKLSDFQSHHLCWIQIEFKEEKNPS